MSTSGDNMSTSGDVQYIGVTMSTSEGYHVYIGGNHEYIGGYHEYIGRCSVHWEDTMSTSWDTMSRSGDVQ